MRRELQEGDKIRLKTRTISGWKGIGTVVDHCIHSDTVQFSKDDESEDEKTYHNFCKRSECSKIRE